MPPSKGRQLGRIGAVDHWRIPPVVPFLWVLAVAGDQQIGFSTREVSFCLWKTKKRMRQRSKKKHGMMKHGVYAAAQVYS